MLAPDRTRSRRSAAPAPRRCARLATAALLLAGCTRDPAPLATPAAAAPALAPPGMCFIAGGEFTMGVDAAAEALCALPGSTVDATPPHRVAVSPFWIDATEVTNEQFAAFVAATRYVTIAEQPPTAAEFPDAPPELLVAGSSLFTPTSGPVALDAPLAWWRWQPGANWRHPEGPDSDLAGRERHPVVHVAYPDALAYAAWAGKRLPTSAEWECAARGGLERARYAWGDELTPGGRHVANLHQGDFPIAGGDTGADGFVGTAPVGSYPKNGFGLFDVAGNVWEWTNDWYRPDTYAERAAAGGVPHDPRGPDEPFDPAEPGARKRVQRGGSFLCSDRYCTRYLVGAIGRGEERTASNHVGFRCARDAAP